MIETFTQMLSFGGKSNSLGRAHEVIEAVLADQSRLNELYDCLADNDAWVRMRAADSIEKICRVHPDWLLPFIDRFESELSMTKQPSIQWHFVQIYSEVDLTSKQRKFAIGWIKKLLSQADVDWIVASNGIKTLAKFAGDGFVTKSELKAILLILQKHKSKAVVKQATTMLEKL